MTDLTEQQEQEMIERAKSGDPEANYKMSLWALDQAMAEPEEERWNRLAAKCLVKAAEAGYEPAKEKMEELLVQTAEAAETPAAPAVELTAPARESAYAPAQEQSYTQTYSPAAAEPAADTAEAPSSKGKLVGVGAAIGGAVGTAAAKVKGLFSRSGKAGTAGTDTAGGTDSSAEKKASFFNFSQWDAAKWKKMQIVCVVICVILVVLIAIMLFTRKNRDDKTAEDVLPTPEAEVVETPAVEITPEPVVEYPDEATREEIAAAALDVFPEDDDFVDEEKSVTVSTSGGDLNLRRGPGQSYSQVGSMSNGTSISVYAYKNGWALVKHNNVWGWCSNDYLK